MRKGSDDEKEKPKLHAEVEAVRAQLAALSRGKKSKLLIDPRTSKHLGTWDLVVGLLLCYTALVTPFEVAFLPLPTEANGRFVINRIIDVFFLVDMVMQLFIMYPEPPPAREIDSKKTEDERAATPRLPTPRSHFEMVTSRRDIALHYLRGWFTIDCLSVLTCIIDIYPLAVASSAAEGANSASGIESLRIMRVLRVLRLVKLVRLVKTSRLLKRWETSIAIDFSTQTMLACVFSYLLAAHWFACILVGMTTFAETPLYTWLGAKGYCHDRDTFVMDSETSERASWELQPQPLSPEYAGLTNVWCVSPWDLWASTYYWMMQLISGAAGGDTNQTDMNSSEKLVFTVLVVASCLLMSQIIASFCDVLSNLNPENTAFRQRMDQLNRYCRTHRLASSTRRDLREYLIRAKHVQAGDGERYLMMLMSPKMQGELSLQINGPWLTTIRFLRKVEVACAVRIALSVNMAVYVPTELVRADSMHYLNHGTVVYRGSVLITGAVWGDDCILRRADMRSRPARALTYANVSLIPAAKLVSIISDSEIVYEKDGTMTSAFRYPIAIKKLRWERMKMALIGLARQIRQKEHKGGMWDLALSQMEDDLERHVDTTPSGTSPDEKGKKSNFLKRQLTGKLHRAPTRGALPTTGGDNGNAPAAASVVAVAAVSSTNVVQPAAVQVETPADDEQTTNSAPLALEASGSGIERTVSGRRRRSQQSPRRPSGDNSGDNVVGEGANTVVPELALLGGSASQ